ncbi:MAG: pyrroloquinoline quinone biosynthesis protein PqqB [Acidobacteria bacterium]|nr:pyrroloquinoline quinone biosynthesis protein PqqB [Acidobacteriota bacterium]MBV9624983.1 pyrroloquinoline quinone biosynthesis protein PqqB [Acidobacteriota bacterium]
MRVEILGTAAGGGFPQWNCACRNCSLARAGTFPTRSRTQLQVALSSDEKSWFLLNASPDVTRQIESSSFLHPSGGTRHSPISGVLLTSAELDQSLGLLLLREYQPLQVFATASVRRILREDNSMFSMLERSEDQARWHDVVPGTPFNLCSQTGGQAGIECLPLSVARRYPSYVPTQRTAELCACEAVLGVILSSGKRLGYFPSIGKIDDSLLEQLNSLDVLLFDGTFWTDDELIRLQIGTRTAREMGHIPVSSPDGSLDLLSGLRCPKKMFVHINNTNPMLDATGPAWQKVRDSGWEIAEEGCHLEL